MNRLFIQSRIRKHKRALRRTLKQARARNRSLRRLHKIPLTPQQKKRRRILKLLLLACLVAYFCRDCTCEPQRTPPQLKKSPKLEQPPAIIPKAPLPQPIKGTVKPIKRPQYVSVPPKPQNWLSTFRLQVAARSPRLAKCFDGSRHPGAIKWIASVEPGQGTVANQKFEPILHHTELSKNQRSCLKKALAFPPYRLKPSQEPSTPSRVGIVIEF